MHTLLVRNNARAIALRSVILLPFREFVSYSGPAATAAIATSRGEHRLVFSPVGSVRRTVWLITHRGSFVRLLVGRSDVWHLSNSRNSDVAIATRHLSLPIALSSSERAGGRYSDNRYSDISKWVMQWVRVREGQGLGLVQWLKWSYEAGGLTWRSQVGANPIPIPYPTNLALFGHKIAFYRFISGGGAHTIAGGSNRSRGLSPPGPLTLTTGLG